MELSAHALCAKDHLPIMDGKRSVWSEWQRACRRAAEQPRSACELPALRFPLFCVSEPATSANR